MPPARLPAFVTVQFTDALWASQLAAQDTLASKFPGSNHVTKTGSGHYIHVEKPEVVTAAVREVVEQVRTEPPR